MDNLTKMIMSKDGKRKMELCAIRANARAERNAKIKEWFVLGCKGAILAIGAYITVIGIYVIH